MLVSPINPPELGHFGKYQNTLCLSPQILHKLCFQFLLGLTNGPKRIHKQCLCKILGDNEEYYGFFFRNGLLNFILKQTLKNMLIGHDSENAL